ncbi:MULTISPECIES: hypothetical protein [Aliagarivorans]|uniref:hypothetical protein n=1 Tax=Aliagarivorans TaxID=882379 RepID=UPI0004159564|nr:MULTISPECIES: hypothetical protein [Aliagarivorans]
MEQQKPHLGILALSLVLIVVGIGVIALVLPHALGILSLPSEAPFMGDFVAWLLADTEALQASAGEEFFEIFQTFVKVIVLLVFLYACLKLVAIGLMIIREGVKLLRPTPAKKSKE